MKGNEEKKEEKGIFGEGQDKQQGGTQGGAPGGAIKENVDNTKNKVKKIKKIINFLRRNPLIAKILFWVILAILIIIIFTIIIYKVVGIDEEDASKSFEGLQDIIRTMNISTGEDGAEDSQTSANTYMTTGGTIKENPDNPGEYAYYLLYGDFSDEEKAEKINKVKTTLAKKNIVIYSNQCLLFIAMLEENGLNISNYRKDELEAMYMFYKAEVATSALDLRSEEDMYENGEYKYPENNLIVPVKEITNTNDSEDITYDYSYQQGDYVEDDYSDDSICGTIRVQKVTYNSSSEEGQLGTTTALTYMPYEEFTAQIGMTDSDSRGADVTKHFTIDEENNLIVAGWSYTNISYDITCEGNSELLEELQEQYQGSTQTDIYQYRSIPYLNYISKYTMPFSFLMSLLATTSDADFCKELAKIAETSYITITLHEEFSQLTTANTTEHTHYDKIYATLTADVGGTITSQNVSEEQNLDVSGYDSYTEILSNYGYYSDSNSSMKKENLPDGQINYTYQWNYNSKIYYFKFTIYRGEEVKTSRKLTYQNIEQVETIKTNTARPFIKKNRELDLNKPTEITGFSSIPEEVESYEEYHNRISNLNAWTKNVETHYTIVGTTVNEYNSYSMEVTEVNNWYEYYKKTYSKVEPEDLGQPDTNHTNIIVPTITNREITEQNEINNLDYVQEISQEQKEKVISYLIGTSDFSNPKFEIKKINEEIYTYGNEEVTVTTTGTKYKRTGDQKEIIQVKVQEGNQEALLTISADAIAVLQNETEDTTSETTTTVTKEQYYGTTDAYKDGFLNIYDKYPFVQNHLNSIEEWTYEMLNSRKSCINITDLLKYLLFLYDGTNLGVTEYNVELLKPNEFKNSRAVNNALEEMLKSYENERLRLYMSGESNDYSSVEKYVTQDRTKYKMYYTDFDGCLNFSYGIMVYNAKGQLNNKERFSNEGYNLQQLVDQYNNGQEVLVDVEVLDRMYSEILRDRKEVIRTKFEEAGLSIKSYELDALTNVSYQYGNCGQYLSGENNITEVYKKYIVEPEKPDYEGFFNNAVCQTESGTVHFFVAGVYINREQYNRKLFETGIYTLANGTEISSGGAVVEFALEHVGEGHTTFTSYNPTNGVQDIWFGDDWCAMFVSYCYNECGLIPEPLPAPYAGCTSKVNEAKADGTFIDRRQNPDYVPEGGDLIFFTHDYVNSYHTGIVTGSDGVKVYTVEGNTGSSSTSPYWHGSSVEEKEHPIDSIEIYGYIPINQ